MSNLEHSYTGLGKRKCAVAKIFLTEGSGTITVNGKSFDNRKFINERYIYITLRVLYYFCGLGNAY